MKNNSPDEEKATSDDKATSEDKATSNEYVLGAFWGTLLLADLSIMGVAFANDSFSRTLFLGLLAGAAAAMVGALLGFLFGLPRSVEDASPALSRRADVAAEVAENNSRSAARLRGRANNNLLEISDWLTKIIVGAGLVGLQDLVEWSGGVAQMIGEGAGLRTVAEARVFGGGTMAFFFGWGFLFVYIQTRTIITRVFADTERSLAEFLEDKVEELEKRVQPQLENMKEATVGAIMNSLYNSPEDALDLARSFLESPANQANASVWVYRACACGQLYADPDYADQRAELREEALDALRRALELNPGLRDWARGLTYEDDPNHIAGDDDLSSFRNDPAFQALIGPPSEDAAS